MGWWEHKKSIVIGDGGLDCLEEALAKFCAEYQEDLMRNPTWDELNATLLLALKGRSFTLNGMPEGEILDIRIQIVAKKKSQKLKPIPGDVFMIKLPTGQLVYGQLQKQYLRVRFYRFIFLKPAKLSQLLSLETVELPISISTKKIESGQWPIVGNFPIKCDRPLIHFKIGRKVTCNEDVGEDGFIHVTAKLCLASQEELKRLDPFRLAGDEPLIEEILKLVEGWPVDK